METIETAIKDSQLEGKDKDEAGADPDPDALGRGFCCCQIWRPWLNKTRAKVGGSFFSLFFGALKLLREQRGRSQSNCWQNNGQDKQDAGGGEPTNRRAKERRRTLDDANYGQFRYMSGVGLAAIRVTFSLIPL